VGKKGGMRKTSIIIKKTKAGGSAAHPRKGDSLKKGRRFVGEGGNTLIPEKTLVSS